MLGELGVLLSVFLCFYYALDVRIPESLCKLYVMASKTCYPCVLTSPAYLAFNLPNQRLMLPKTRSIL